MKITPITLNFTAHDAARITMDMDRHDKIASLALISSEEVVDLLHDIATQSGAGMTFDGKPWPRLGEAPTHLSELHQVVARALLRLFPEAVSKVDALLVAQTPAKTKSLIEVAERAVEAERLADKARAAKRDLSWAYCDRKDELGIIGRVDRDSPEWQKIEAATEEEYLASQEAKRVARNAKSRLQTAIRRYQKVTTPIASPDPFPATCHDPDTIPF